MTVNAFNAELIQRYDVPGPRYTSYPSAAQFSTAFPRSEYETALRRSHARGGPLSLYVHVPFCESPCFYCACNKVITRQQTMGAIYLERLLQEIGLHTLHITQPRPVQQLHFGGGTPTFLSTPQLGRLIGAIDRGFGLMEDAEREYSIEIDPRRLGPHSIADLASLGFNRISLGVQDFDPAVQQAVNRLQGFSETQDSVVQARMHGFRSVGIDLICGLPKQTERSFARTLDRTLVLLPDRLSIYSYAHLPQLFKPQQRINATDLPDAATKLRMMQMAINRLTADGYEYIGMDHFARRGDELAIAARQGRLHRNFQGYSTHSGLDLIGLGVSAISHVDGCYSQNARQLDAYYGLLDHGRLPVERGLLQTADDRLREEVIQALMCRGAIAFGPFNYRHGVDFRQTFAAELSALSAMADDGLVTLDSTRLAITPQGRYLLRAIAMVFDRHLQPATDVQMRHSRVI